MRRHLEDEPALLRRGLVGVLHAIVDRVVDDYGPVVAGLRVDDPRFARADVSGRL